MLCGGKLWNRGNLFPVVLIISFLLYSSSGVIKGNSLNIPKGLSESANQKGQTIIIPKVKRQRIVNKTQKRKEDMIATTTNGTYTWSSVTHLMEQELLTLPEHLSSSPVFSGVRVTRSCFMYIFCRSLFVPLCFFFWPVCCLFFFDIRILITPLVSSNSS